jgi:hypothetical protein
MLIARALFDPSNAVAVLCGPEVMMRFTVLKLEKRGIAEDRIYLSLERNMKCGHGSCGRCQFGRIWSRSALELISAFLHQRKPNITAHSVCAECKQRGNVCVMVAHGVPCLGPVTQAGCGAICPAYARGCYGCFGPKETPDTAATSARCASMGTADSELLRIFRTFNAWAEPFREESAAHEAHRR